jgi:hypothetical protein
MPGAFAPGSEGSVLAAAAPSVPHTLADAPCTQWPRRLLLLCQATAGGGDATTTSSHLSADLPTKLRYYAACAADERFPEFTGGLVDGRYSRDMFSPDECRQRHADIISRLITVFGFAGGGGI